VSDVECSDDGPLYLKDPCKASYDGVAFTGVRKLELKADGTCASVTTIAGYYDPANPKVNPTGFADGPVSTAKFHYIHAVALQPLTKQERRAGVGGVSAASTELYICDDNNYRIRQLNVTTGIVSTLAGTGRQGCADGDSSTATFGAVGLGIGADATVYVADYLNHRIRKLVHAAPTPAPPPTPQPKSGCHIDHVGGISYVGGNIFGDHHIVNTSSTADGCCKICQQYSKATPAHTACVFYQWDSASCYGHPGACCRLKDKTAWAGRGQGPSTATTGSIFPLPASPGA
jgi:hypothetical protein